jgi:hypothetical protein
MAPVADHVAVPAPGIGLPYRAADCTRARFGAVQVDQFLAADEAATPVTGIHHP